MGGNGEGERAVGAGGEAGEGGRDSFVVAGESTVCMGGSRAVAEAEEVGADPLFAERAGDVVNYYYYAARLSGAVALCGHAVNLHIAVGGGRSAVGSPLIFGGY